jgi:hypothetical protein
VIEDFFLKAAPLAGIALKRQSKLRISTARVERFPEASGR